MDKFAEKLNEQKIQFVRILPGPIEKIFAYLWDGEKRGEWFASGAMPTMPGERFEMRFKHSDYSPHKSPPPEKMAEIDRNGHGSMNTLIAYEPPHRLAFTFGAEKHPGQVSEVEFLLAQEGDPKDNKVRLTLTHSKIPDRLYAGRFGRLAQPSGRAGIQGERRDPARLLGHLAEIRRGLR